MPAKSSSQLLSLRNLSIAAVVAGIAIVLILVIASGQGGGSASPIRSPSIPIPSGLANDRTLGDPNAPVTIDEWADFQCPVCRAFFETIEPSLRQTYIDTGEVKLVFHDYPFIGPESIQAAAAARVSEALGPGFWPYHDMLYTNQGSENSGAFSQSRLADMAVALGMDRNAFMQAMADPKYVSAVNEDMTAGSQLGVDSTPTLRIGGQLYPGLPTWSQLSALIDGLLASPGPSGSP